MRDDLFIKVIYVLVGVIVSYGVGAGVVVLLTGASDDVVVRYISAFGTIFTGLLGMCTGYLMGRRNGNGKP